MYPRWSVDLKHCLRGHKQRWLLAQQYQHTQMNKYLKQLFPRRVYNKQWTEFGKGLIAILILSWCAAVKNRSLKILNFFLKLRCCFLWVFLERILIWILTTENLLISFWVFWCSGEQETVIGKAFCL